VDILVDIIEHLPSQDRCRFSATCRPIRRLSKSYLFGSISVGLEHPISTSECFPVPHSLWPAVRSLTITDKCVDRLYSTRSKHDCDKNMWYPKQIRHTDDPMVCGVLQGGPLVDVLISMPRLSALVLRSLGSRAHGPPWAFIHEILSLPHLRHLDIDQLRYCPKPDSSSLTLSTAHTVSTIRSFVYRQDLFRTQPALASESRALEATLRAAHTTLECIALPTEPAPIHTFAALPWPRLRELRLTGPAWTEPSTPLVFLLASMPHLRILVLNLAPPALPHTAQNRAPWGIVDPSNNPVHAGGSDDGRVTPVWPRTLTPPPATFPWRDLEHLTLSAPDPDDSVFAHLPPTLRALSLRPFPHHCVALWRAGDVALARRLGADRLEALTRSPLLTARDLTRIVTACPGPMRAMRELRVEYLADAGEAAALRAVVARFPRLRALEVHRYRPRDGEASLDLVRPPPAPAPLFSVHQADGFWGGQDAVARILAGLRELRTLKVHLDLPNMVDPTRLPAAAKHRDLARLYAEFYESMRVAVEGFARLLAPALESVWVLHTSARAPAWRVYEVSCEGGITLTQESAEYEMHG
ncbi:uncharacterized protein BXZ73DRAFT_44638, partial [Epithele typhae]|uniref:uncharacterized protein n=1 Tax=Epithele typhae TaxID=378194 RepID=UPI0020086A06